MITIIKETELKDFEAWSGGQDTLDYLTGAEIEALGHEIETMYPEGLSATGLNDYLWFERDSIAYMFGYEDWEELLEERYV